MGKHIFFVLLAFLSSYSAKATEEVGLYVRHIQFSGNFSTKEATMLRELPFIAGEKLAVEDLRSLEKEAANRLYKLGLFNETEVRFRLFSTDSCDVEVRLRERFYHHPGIIVQLADRNFNEWWTSYDHDFKRLVLGGTYMNLNLSGHNDRLWLGGFGGPSDGFIAGYSLPYLTKHSQTGFELNSRFNTSKKIKVKTVNDRQEALRDSTPFFQEFLVGAIVKERVDLTQTLFEGLHLYHLHVGGNTLLENAGFIADSINDYWALIGSLRFEDDHRDVRDYPLKGYWWSLENENWFGLNRKLNINNFYASAMLFQPLGKEFYLSAQLKSKLSLPQYKSYYLQKGLGYEQDYVRGFEYMVVDGQHYALLRTNIKRKIWDGRVSLFPRLIRRDFFKHIRFASFGKVYADVGYVYKPGAVGSNQLPNKLLLGMGGGIDLIGWYETVLRLEYSFARPLVAGGKWTNGFYLSFDLDLKDGMHISKRSRNLFSY